MSLDLTLEEQDVMDYVQGKISEPPSSAPVAAKTKNKKGEVKAKKIIRDSIHKHLVPYISNLNTSTGWLACSNLAMQTKFFSSRTS